MLITVVKDPAQITENDVYNVAGDVLLSDWIIEQYGEDGFSVPTKIFIGGLSEKHEIQIDDFDYINRIIKENVYIVHHPLGIIESTTFITGAIFSAAIERLIPIPKLPTGERQERRSPNNSLSGQSNIARPLERVPDIFGQVKSYPDLIAPTVFEYIDHVLFSTEYMCISRGYLDISDIRSGDTLVSSIVGSSVQVYAPGQTPSEILKTVESNEVKRLTLNPPNDSGVIMGGSFIVSYDSGTDEAVINGPANIWVDYTTGSSATVEDLYFDSATETNVDGVYVVAEGSNESVDISTKTASYNSGTGDGTISGNFSAFRVGAYARISYGTIDIGFSANIDGYYRVKSASASSVVLENAGSVNSTWTYFTSTTLTDSRARIRQSYIALSNASTINANWTSLSSPLPVLELLTVTESRLLNPVVFLPDEILVRGPFVVPGGDANDEIWLDFTAPRGLALDSSKNYTVSISVLLEETDSAGTATGPSFTVNYDLTDNELDPRFYTKKITSADGLEAGKYYRISAQRTSDTSVGNANLIDQIQWARLAGIEDITEDDTTGTTRIQIKTQATEQTSSLQDRKFNMQASRKVITWNGSSVVGDISTGASLAASSRMADCFLHYALDPALGARAPANVNVTDIYAIQDSLDLVFDGALGEFNYTFDNQNTPALEEMRQIANAARCSIFREGSVISMVRDEKQEISRALFNRRNKKPDSETKTIMFNKPLDHDGVQLEYRDKVDNKTKTILLPDDLEVGDPNYDLPEAINPLKVEATGVANEQQAWNRAQYELNRIIHSRVKVETKVTEEGILLPLNARIDHVDGTTLSRVQSNGEITAYDGLTVTTSERCIFDQTKLYSVILRDADGTPDDPITVTARTDTEFGFNLVSLPSFSLFVRGENYYQVGTLYNFSPDGDELSNQYLVQRKQPDEFGNVTLELINYTDKYYQADPQAAPALRAFSSGFDEGFE
jgi:hypothetical protein